MFIELTEGILDLGIILKEFLKEHCILFRKLMCGNAGAALLWLRLLDKYPIKECNMTISKADYKLSMRNMTTVTFNLR